MEYHDNQKISLGDIVELDMPEGTERAKVVMLGSNYEHLELSESFEKWVKKDKILETDSIVIEWIGKNPLAHDDPNSQGRQTVGLSPMFGALCVN